MKVETLFLCFIATLFSVTSGQMVKKGHGSHSHMKNYHHHPTPKKDGDNILKDKAVIYDKEYMRLDNM